MMAVTTGTYCVAIGGLLIMGLLMTLQLIAVFKPRAPWTVAKVYGGAPEGTDPKAYFAFNQGYA